MCRALYVVKTKLKSLGLRSALFIQVSFALPSVKFQYYGFNSLLAIEFVSSHKIHDQCFCANFPAMWDPYHTASL